MSRRFRSIHGAATDWWPDRKRAVRRWREWLASQGLSLIEVTRADGRQDEEQPGKPHDPRATIWQARQRFSGLLPATAGGRLVASMPAAAVMHVALAQVLRPAWEHHLAQNRRQAELAEQERLDQENQQRQHALNEEKTRQRQLWVQEQFRGMTPWNEFARFMGARPHRGSPQLWTGLRWTSGHWTVTGVTLHEPEPGLWQPSLADVGVVANLIAAPTSWPSEPERGWPAWRFQWQFEAAQASPAKEAP